MPNPVDDPLLSCSSPLRWKLLFLGSVLKLRRESMNESMNVCGVCGGTMLSALRGLERTHSSTRRKKMPPTPVPRTAATNHKPQTTNSTRFSLHHPTSRPDLATTTAQPLRSFSETRGAAVFGGSWRRNSRNREDCPQGLHKQRTHSATQHPHCTHTHAHSSLVLSWLLHSARAHAHVPDPRSSDLLKPCGCRILPQN
jgi:hypothetical protein